MSNKPTRTEKEAAIENAERKIRQAENIQAEYDRLRARDASGDAQPTGDGAAVEP